MHDIIGDIHGSAESLKKLHEKPGYTESNGSWHHPVRVQPAGMKFSCSDHVCLLLPAVLYRPCQNTF